jgi:hypothetical protein
MRRLNPALWLDELRLHCRESHCAIGRVYDSAQTNLMDDFILNRLPEAVGSAYRSVPHCRNV